VFGKDLITTQEWSLEEIETTLELARNFKRKHMTEETPEPLRRKTFFMLFYATSTRTRAAFEAAMTLLGGHAQFIDVSTTRLSEGEKVKDIAKMYERYGHGLGIRILDDAIDYLYGAGNRVVREYAEAANIPVINMADDMFHPTQGLADLMTIQEKLGKMEGKKYVIMWGYSKKLRGRCSIQEEMLIMTRFGMNVVLTYPKGFELDEKLVSVAKENAAQSGGSLELVHDYEVALDGAHVVFPRSWVSHTLCQVGASRFGGDKEIEIHNKHRDWILRTELIEDLMDSKAIITHVLPVLRGEEATDEVMDSPHSAIYDQAENGLYTKMAVLASTMASEKFKNSV